MVCSLVVDSEMQGRCGDYCGNMGSIEQQTMVGSTGKGVGAHGFCCSIRPAKVGADRGAAVTSSMLRVILGIFDCYW